MTSSDISNGIIEAMGDALKEKFCTNCPAITCTRGPQENGIAIGPDETDCPASFDYSDRGCEKYDEYREIELMAEKLAESVAA